MAPSIGIIYGSGEGQAEKIAGHIARQLDRREFDVDTYDARDLPAGFDLEGYDGVIIGASVHGGRYPRRIARLVRDHHEELTARSTAFFSVSLTASDESEEAQGEIHGLIDDFLDDVQWQPQLVQSFAGAIPFSRYGFVKRWIMKLVLRGRGEVVDTSQDYEYTDWEEVDAFADRVADLVGEAKEDLERPRPM